MAHSERLRCPPAAMPPPSRRRFARSSAVLYKYRPMENQVITPSSLTPMLAALR
jgi:hypothetical protein